MSRIAIVSTYPPRRCGIAMFTAEMARSLRDREIVALHHGGDGGRPQLEVHHVIRTAVREDHVRAARALGGCGVGVVSLQHEYGIWGGDDGEHVLDFLAALSVPAVATLHTVLREPTPRQHRIMRGIVEMTSAVAVMSPAGAVLLEERYGADPSRIDIIPHGVPDLPQVDPDSVKPGLGLEGRRVLLTFGLLGPGKGCEAVIAAMPAVVERVPSACYVILGATHPDLLETEGERYRDRLRAQVADLGLSRHVLFVDRFVGRVELARWLEAADVFVTPYPNLDQVVSGTLSYAMAAGKASVSTPYLYATEILADGRGVLVTPGSPAAMTEALTGLLLDEPRRASMAQRAYDHGRTMTWSRVAGRYGALFDRVQPGARVAVPVGIAAFGA